MTKPVALLDVDGVFADFTGRYLRTIAELFGEHRISGRGEVDRWEIHHWAGLTEEERRTVDAAVAGTRGWCRSIAPLPGAIEAAARLREEAECIAVTAPWSGDFWHKERIDWIGEILGIDHKHIIFAHRKDRIDGDLFLDDKPQNVIDWARAQLWRGSGATLPQFSALLWHAPHNASAGELLHARRVFIWNQVYEALERLQGAR